MALVFGASDFVLAKAHAQNPFAPPPTQSSAPSPADDTNPVTNSPFSVGAASPINQNPDETSSSTLGSPQSLSADQIIRILQQNPNLVLQIKSQLADQMQQQGTPIDANDISDEILYSQIATNARLRANITTFLRAHGYVSQDDLAVAGTSAENVGSEKNIAPTQESSLFPGDSGAATSAAESSNLLRPSMPSETRSADSRKGSVERRHEDVTASTDAPKVLRQPAPYNLESMRDLYTQLPEETLRLRRFGSEVFVNRNSSAMMRGSSTAGTPLDVPLGPDYVLGPGDTLRIEIWGGITQSTDRTINQDGHVLLPEAGSVQVAGLSLDRAGDLIRNALKRQYRDAQVAVTVARLHSVRIYIVGDVQRPGGYDISSLATPLSALFVAGGPTSAGSLRIAKHYRGTQLVEEIDLYDFLVHGIRNGSARFESGDTLLVPPAGPQVVVSGAVKRPAVYELKADESTLNSVLHDAGGLTVAASLSHITIERIDANRQRETVTLNIGDHEDLRADHVAIDHFKVMDGDRIHIAPILPYSERAIYLEGHVVRPGRLPYTDGMHLSDVLHSYRDMLPEPSAHGEIVRLVPPDLHAEMIDFDVPDVLIGNVNITLEPFDTIRIFGRYQVDTPTVTIHGEVLRPGTYPMSKGMTAAQLVRMAGGFKRDALREAADLTSYDIVNGERAAGVISVVRIGAAASGTDQTADVPLKPGDILTIHQITGWNDIGQSVMIEGQVRFPGNYGFQEGERLSSVLRRAGGFRSTAYPEGAVLIRPQVRDLEERSRDELIRQIETTSTSARLSPALAKGDTGETLQLIKAQQDQALADLKSHPSTGRLVVHIGADIDSWANTPADIELRSGDVLTIPKRPGFVLVTGQVYNATAITFAPSRSAGWYLSRAGGTNSTANRKEIFIIRANGSVIGRHSGGWFDADVLSTRLNPGDVVVVPQKILGASLLWRNLLTTAQLASSIAITAGIAVAAL
jgi:protein involved in polysaccharide export with SLBB domain